MTYLYVTVEVSPKSADKFQHPVSFPQNLRTKSYEKLRRLWNERSPVVALVKKVVKKKDLRQWCLNSIWPQRQTVLQMKWRKSASVAQHPWDPGEYSPGEINARSEDCHSFHTK